MAAITDFLTPLPVWTERGEILMPPFGREHRAWLIICLLLGIGLIRTHRLLARDGRMRRRLDIAVAMAPPVFLAIHIASMLVYGVFNASCLPLHICNLCELLAAGFALTGNESSGTVLYGVGSVGSLAALLFPGWTYAPALSLPSVCGFMEHLLVLLFIIMKLRDKSIRPDFRQLWQPIAFTGAYAVAVYPVNKLYGTNFAFINWAPPDTPLALWERLHGDPGYLAIYALAFIALEIALFLPWRTTDARNAG